jgi:lipopolysaccharide export system protein LptA
MDAAESIHVDVAAHEIKLVEDASMIQDGATVRGESLIERVFNNEVVPNSRH